MGAGVHGGFGNTQGSRRNHSLKKGKFHSQHVNHTRESLLRELDGQTPTSSAIADKIRRQEIKINVLDDNLFNRYLGYDNHTLAVTVGKQVYLRKNSASIISELVHEGQHALDFIHGIKESSIRTWPGEIRAYKAEREFQMKTKRPVDFANENDLLVHVWRNYKREE